MPREVDDARKLDGHGKVPAGWNNSLISRAAEAGEQGRVQNARAANNAMPEATSGAQAPGTLDGAVATGGVGDGQVRARTIQAGSHQLPGAKVDIGSDPARRWLELQSFRPSHVARVGSRQWHNAKISISIRPLPPSSVRPASSQVNQLSMTRIFSTRRSDIMLRSRCVLVWQPD